MPSGAGNLLILALPFVLIGFMMWSQRKRAQQVQLMQDSLAVGDQIVTTSGLFATITVLDDAAAHLQIADGVVVRWDRRAIGSTVEPTSTSSDATSPVADPQAD